MVLLFEAIKAHSRGEWLPLWSRADGGGIITGSLGAFLVLESRAHAEARGAHIYATIDHRRRRSRQPQCRRLEKRLSGSLRTGADLPAAARRSSPGRPAFRISPARKGGSGRQFPGAAMRGYRRRHRSRTESQFPLGWLWQRWQLDSKAKVPPFDRGA
jgi:3-oxoacyl-[acyl-carrier-protein] synthase II